MVNLETFPYFEFCVAFILFAYVLENYLSLRQHSRYKLKQVPTELKSIIGDEKFVKSQNYHLDKSRFGFVSGFIDMILNFVIIYYLPCIWDYSFKILEKLSHYASRTVTEDNEIQHSVAFFLVYFLISNIIKLPFSLYSTFVIEERHGFNKQTLKLFIIDEIKTIFLTVVIGSPVVAGVIAIIQLGGQYFYIYVWLFVTFIGLVFMILYPNVIAPWFNKFTPVPEGELRDKIFALAQRVDFPLTQLFIVDGSTRSAHSNAYFYGFFKNKRIVVYDTLINQVSTDEIIPIIAHELGHYKKSHNLKRIIISQIEILAFFFLFGQMIYNQHMYHAFGFSAPRVFIGLILFSMLYQPIEHVLGFLGNIWSRSMEFEADQFAVDMGYDLRSGLLKLHLENLSNLNPDPWYSAYHYTHPPLLERQRAIKRAIDVRERKAH
jgi:STE24 endopeptidase